MKAKALILLMLFTLCYSRSAQAAGRISVLKVFIDCDGDDVIGSRVCFAVKEKIRASHGFQLTGKAERQGFCIHLVSLDAGDQGADSAIAVTITGVLPNQAELYLTTVVLIVGSERVQSIAEGIIAQLEKHTEFMRE